MKALFISLLISALALIANPVIAEPDIGKPASGVYRVMINPANGSMGDFVVGTAYRSAEAHFRLGTSADFDLYGCDTYTIDSDCTLLIEGDGDKDGADASTTHIYYMVRVNALETSGESTLIIRGNASIGGMRGWSGLVENLPAGTEGKTYQVTDGSTPASCNTGGGTNDVLCIYDGANFIPIAATTGLANPLVSDIDAGGVFGVTNLPEPTLGTDAARKSYVDTMVKAGYEDILILDDPLTASDDFAAFVKPYLSNSNPYNRGSIRLAVYFQLHGANALVPERDCYNDSGNWEYTACFIWHRVRDGGTDFIGNYPDSAGRLSVNGPLAQGASDQRIILDLSGRIEVDQDLDNDGLVEVGQSDTIIFEFGNGWMNGWVFTHGQLDGSSTVATLPASPANGTNYEVTDAVDTQDCTTGGNPGTKAQCVYSAKHNLWYPGLFDSGEDKLDTLGSSVNLTGQLTYKVIDWLDGGVSGQGLPNMGPLDRLNENSNSTVAIVAYNDATYTDSKDWKIWVTAQDNDDIGFVNNHSWGSILPSFSFITNGGEGLGAWFMGNPNMTAPQSTHFRQLDYGYLFGDPVYGDSPPVWEDCNVLRATDLDAQGPVDPPDDDAGDEGSCSRDSLMPRGITIDGSMSEGNVFGPMVFATPISRSEISAYIEAGSFSYGYPLSFGPYFCDGVTGTNPLPENSPAAEASQCADSGGGAAKPLPPYIGDYPGLQFRFNALNYGQGHSENCDACGPILLGANSSEFQDIHLGGVQYMQRDATTGEEFDVASAISSSGGPRVYLETERRYPDDEASDPFTDYYNLNQVGSWQLSNEAVAVSWKDPATGDDVFIEAPSARYYESTKCFSEGATTPIVSVSHLKCDADGENCSTLGATANVVSASASVTASVSTPLKIDQFNMIKLVPTVTTAPEYLHCSVRWHK